jgi:hypothetical protein
MSKHSFKKYILVSELIRLILTLFKYILNKNSRLILTSLNMHINLFIIKVYALFITFLHFKEKIKLACFYITICL